jgi:uncharacterized protein (TIGR00369 family)
MDTLLANRRRDYGWRDPRPMMEAAARTAGLDFLQRVVANEWRAPIQDTLGMDLVEIESGRALWRLQPQEFHYNPAGTLHGGVFTALLDSAMACAIWSTLPAGHGWTTMELKVGLLRAVTAQSGLLSCEGRIIAVGQRSGAAEAKIHDAAGRLCAYASTTCMIFRPDSKNPL